MDSMLSKTSDVKQDNGWPDSLSLLLLLIIVIRHASLPDWLDRGYTLFDQVGKGIVSATSGIVPFFFLLTGYIFFRDIPKKPGVSWFGDKYKRSLFVVIIPYLIANVITWVIYVALHKLAPDMLSGFFGDDWKNILFVFWTGPINLSLWLVRELIVLCLISPLLWLLIRYSWGGVVVVIGILWYFHIVPEPLFWFSLGAALAVLLTHCQRMRGWLDRHPVRLAFLRKDWAWFVFLYHYIPQIAMKKIGVALLPEATSGGLIAVWIGNALILLIGLTLVYYLLYRFAPKLLAVLTGSVR